MILIEILLIAIIITIVIDLTDLTESIKLGINKLLFPKINLNTIHLPLIECSMCLTFWSGLIYSIIVSQLNIYLVAYILIISFNTDIIKDIIIKLKDKSINLINKL